MPCIFAALAPEGPRKYATHFRTEVLAALDAYERDGPMTKREGDSTDTHTVVTEREDGCVGLVVLLYHQNGAELVELRDGEAVVVGRAWPADVRIEDTSLSRRHAAFSRSGNDVWVEDLGSKNGTLVDGKPVRRHRVRADQSVVLGNVRALAQWTLPTEMTRGLMRFDRFEELLEYEVDRHRQFKRELCLLLVRAEGESAQMGRWWEVLDRLLRPVDRMTAYDPRSMLLLLPETTRIDGERLAAAVAADGSDATWIRCGVAHWPSSAMTHQELLARARQSCLSADRENPVDLAERASVPSIDELGTAIVASPQMRSVYSMAERFAATTVPVLIFGETGTGKELVAGTVHRKSGRTGRLCAINCAAIPTTLVESTLFGHERGAFTGASGRGRGVFEEANGGTVFLDELGELSASAQASLLRVLETGAFTRVGGTREVRVDVRVVAATHQDLDSMARDGRFRRDLLFRLDTVTIRVPALRARKEEIGPLVRHFATSASARFGVAPKNFSDEALSRLQAYHWPGNVRELRNVVERAIVLATGPSVRPEDLPEKVRGRVTGEETSSLLHDRDVSHRERMKQFEIALILDALRRADGNQSLAARLLRMPLRTLVHKIASYDLKYRYEEDQR